MPPPDPKKVTNLLQILSTNTDVLAFKYKQVLFEYTLNSLQKMVVFPLNPSFSAPKK